MKFFRRIVDLWLHTLLLTDGPQEPLNFLSDSEHGITVGKDLQGTGASPLIDSSSECEYGPNNRQCWSPGFNITTDYERYTPDTGITRQVDSQANISSL